MPKMLLPIVSCVRQGLPHNTATVDVDGLSGDVFRNGGTQIGDEPGDFLIGGGPFHRDGVDVTLPEVVATQHIHTGRINNARADGVDADGVRRQFLRRPG